KSDQPQYDNVLYVGSLDSTGRTRLFHTDSQAVYVPPGYLVFMRENSLVAQPFDTDRLRVTGEPQFITEDQIDRTPGPARGAFGVSQNGGAFAYRTIAETQLMWVDRAGRTLDAIGGPGRYGNPSLSPDERQVAVTRVDPATGGKDIWLIDLVRGGSSRFTFDSPEVSDMPLWSADGS